MPEFKEPDVLRQCNLNGEKQMVNIATIGYVHDSLLRIQHLVRSFFDDEYRLLNGKTPRFGDLNEFKLYNVPKDPLERDRVFQEELYTLLDFADKKIGELSSHTVPQGVFTLTVPATLVQYKPEQHVKFSSGDITNEFRIVRTSTAPGNDGLITKLLLAPVSK